MRSRGDSRWPSIHGNSVPRFHVTNGTGPEVVRIFAEPVLEAASRGQVTFLFRHQVDDLIVENGAAVGVRGSLLEPSHEPRGVKSSRVTIGPFERRAQAVIVTSGGIGHNHDLVRQNWPTDRLGPAPRHMLRGPRPRGRSDAADHRACRWVCRMWHYVEGLKNWDPIWPGHAIRLLAGPSSLWLDADGNRLPPPYFPGHDTLGTLRHILRTGHDYSWFVLTGSIIAKEFGLSGSEQNPALTGKHIDPDMTLKQIQAMPPVAGVPGPVQAFLDHGEDFVTANNLRDLVDQMNTLGRGGHLDYDKVQAIVVSRDQQIGNDFSKDLQLMAVRNARKVPSDKAMRITEPHRLLDPEHGPLIAVRLNILTRKTLGGLETNLDSQVIRPDGTPFQGLYAAGEVAGFGGGGVHGYNALEGTFLGGCIFSGRAAGRAVARTT